MTENTAIQHLIQSYGDKIDLTLKQVISQESTNELYDYLNKPIWYHMGNRGKRLRPALCLVTCELLGGNPDSALGFAAACEIMHNYLLLHDDIMDGDTVRRDLPTVWVKFGVPNAINCGDYMCAQGLSAILNSNLSSVVKIRLVDAYCETLVKTCEGQALDVNHRADAKFTVKKYMELATLKTGHYLICPVVGGAIIAGAPKSVIERLWELGSNIGAAFQIRDDIIDLGKGKGRGGAVGNDIREGKPSILYAHLISVVTPQEKKRLLGIFSKKRQEKSDSDVQWVIELFSKYDSVKFAEDYSISLKDKALNTVNSVNFKDKQTFTDIANYIINRSQ